jgi:hypothetical protein
MNQKIKIISGHTEEGGSTIIFIKLTNQFNEIGYDCTFYGPHNWHLDKCKSDILSVLKIEKTDILIYHYFTLEKRPDAKKVIFACHEKWWWNFSNIFKYWDIAVFLHEEHRQFHKEYVGDYVIIPNLKDENLKPKKKKKLNLIAGVIGNIEDRKQTHISIQRALSNHCTKVLIYGNIGNQKYYEKYVKPFLFDERVEWCGYITNKQKMYDSIGRVYHSSTGEVACLVKDECASTNTKFFGNLETNHEVSKLTNTEILEKWKSIFDIQNDPHNTVNTNALTPRLFSNMKER